MKAVFSPIIALFFVCYPFFNPPTLYGQSWIWANNIGNDESNSRVVNIRQHGSNEIITGGTFAAASLSLGIFDLYSAGQEDGYIAVGNENGDITWAERIGGSSRDYVTAIASDLAGNIYVAGQYYSLSLNIGGITLTNSGESDGFLVKFNPDKSVAWVRKIGTSKIEEITGLTTDSDGNIYIAGQRADPFLLAFDEGFIYKIDPTNTILWEHNMVSNNGFMGLTSLVTDDEGENLYLGGLLYGTVFFNNISLTSEQDYFSGFITRFDTENGDCLTGIICEGTSRVNAMTTSSGKLLACSEKVEYGFGWGWPLSSSKILVQCYQSDLNSIWQKQAGGETLYFSLDIAKSISTDDQGNVYVCGSFFSDTLAFAGQSLANIFHINYYYPQVFVLKYSPTGDEIWGKSMGGALWDEATAISAIADDKFYLGGQFESDNIQFDSHILANNGQVDSIYVHLMPARFGRKSIGFLALFDEASSSLRPDPVQPVFSIFPNPGGDLLYIDRKDMAGQAEVIVSGLDGRIMLEITGSDAIIEAATSDLAPGIYLITLKTSGNVVTRKWIKG